MARIIASLWIILALVPGLCGSLAAAEAGQQDNGSVFFEYDESNPPAVFFFPPEKARWDGTKITVREWYLLSDYQKERFINEYLDEMRKQFNLPIDVVSMDYLRALNMFSYFSNSKSAAQPTTKVIDKLLSGQGKVVSGISGAETQGR